ncbi:MAG TPA: helix-turn-helix transcriptional regulator [Phycisphaerae bacterium]|jgi:transcriptional regulator with XRE-family HTH domain|nr:helix-turn-helix transcriptional regulator [Phycisphaerae bacterium]
MAEKTKTISDQLRAAIIAAPVSRYRIAQETGVSEAALSRFVRGERGLDLTSVDRLAAYLELSLSPRSSTKGR